MRVFYDIALYRISARHARADMVTAAHIMATGDTLLNRTRPLSPNRGKAAALVVVLAAAALVVALISATLIRPALANVGDLIHGAVTSQLTYYLGPSTDSDVYTVEEQGYTFAGKQYTEDGWYIARDSDGTLVYFRVDAGVSLYEPTSNYVMHGAVVGGSMNMLVAPDPSAAVHGTLPAGSTIQFASFNADYYMARDTDNTLIFIPVSQVSLYAPSSSDYVKRYAADSGAFAYQAPDFSSAQLSSFAAGTALTLGEFNSDWYMAYLSVDGARTLVFVPKSQLSENPASNTVTDGSRTITYQNYDITLTQLTQTESHPSWIKYTNGIWVPANDDDLRYYLNPANFPQDSGSFYQFLRLDQPSGLSVDTLNQVVAGNGVLDGQGQAFYDAARTYNVNEVYLVSHAFLESGRGTSYLAAVTWYDPDEDMVYYLDDSGKAWVSTYRDSAGVKHQNVYFADEAHRTTFADDFPYAQQTNTSGVDFWTAHPHAAHVYNFFGIGAVDSNPSNGGRYAYEHGWTSPYEAIMGGAKFISATYLAAGEDTLSGQNTLYKMLYHPEQAVLNYQNGSYEKPWHEYATAIAWASDQTELITYIYKNYVSDNVNMTFEVPRYAGD